MTVEHSVDVAEHLQLLLLLAVQQWQQTAFLTAWHSQLLAEAKQTPSPKPEET
jgi:hypothetical protein